MKKTIFLIATFLFVILSVSAKLTITRTTCNYQQGLAISKGDIRVGWQLSSDTQGERQTAYEIRVFENITNKKIFSSGKIKSDKSQLISLPSLPANTHGYCWDVRVWNMKGEKSAFSKRQIIRIVPQTIDARWVGAITKKDAKLPEGRYSNGVFKKEEFKNKWKDVDSISAKSIIVRKEFRSKQRRITDATVYVCGLGHYELCINGRKVGDAEFAPLWSEYSKTVYYNVYDVTNFIKADNNAISVLLGNGFFQGLPPIAKNDVYDVEQHETVRLL